MFWYSIVNAEWNSLGWLSTNKTKTNKNIENYLTSKRKFTSDIIKYLLRVRQILPNYTWPSVKTSDTRDTLKCSNAGSSNELYPTISTYYHLTSAFSCQVYVAFFSWHFWNTFPKTVFPLQAEVLNSFSSLVSSLKSCSHFTTASHKRYFTLAHCSAFPQPIHTHTFQTAQKTLKICILHIKLQTRVNKEPKQNRLAYKESHAAVLAASETWQTPCSNALDTF